MIQRIKNKLPPYLVFRIQELRRTITQGSARTEYRKKCLKFYSEFVRTGDLVFDVGSNVGDRIDVFLKLGAKIVAIEPQEYCVNILRHRFGEKVVIVNSGLCEEESEREIHISSALPLVSSFSEEWISKVKDTKLKGYEWDKTAKIRMTTLDNLIKKHGLPRFIKIDVEGYELEVLKGLNSTVDTISFEYTYPEYRNRAVECLNRISQINSKLACNFSIDEDMEFALPSWVGIPEMISIVNESDQLGRGKGAGDIYVAKRET